MLHIVLTVFVLVLGGLAVWQEVRLGNIEKDIKNLKFAKGQDIPRQEFDALKMLVNRLRRGNRNEV